jgi:hypothetical protein
MKNAEGSGNALYYGDNLDILREHSRARGAISQRAGAATPSRFIFGLQHSWSQ